VSDKGPDDGVDFFVAMVATIGIVIALGCMVYMFVSTP
jgi:hypothetical protein